jgi:hypothetical protein
VIGTAAMEMFRMRPPLTGRAAMFMFIWPPLIVVGVFGVSTSVLNAVSGRSSSRSPKSWSLRYWRSRIASAAVFHAVSVFRLIRAKISRVGLAADERDGLHPPPGDADLLELVVGRGEREDVVDHDAPFLTTIRFTPASASVSALLDPAGTRAHVALTLVA